MVSRTHQALIAKLFPKVELSQCMAANFIEKYQPALSDGVEGVLREAATVNARVLAGEITVEQGREYMGSFAVDGMGIMPATVEDGLKFLSDGAGLSAEDIAAIETPGSEPAQTPQAPQEPAKPARAAAPVLSPLAVRVAELRQELQEHTKKMSAEPGSAAWKAYWKEGGAEAYRVALERLQSYTDEPAAAPEPGPAQPAAVPEQLMGAIGIPADLASPTLELIANATLDGTSTEAIEDQALVDHVEASMKADPAAYFRSTDAQREYAESLARLNAPQRATGPGYGEEARSADTRRRGEIEQAMRTDGGKPYWSSPLMQKEYGEILARQTAPPPMPAQEPESEPELESGLGAE
jgi:hypothetical protein